MELWFFIWYKDKMHDQQALDDFNICLNHLPLAKQSMTLPLTSSLDFILLTACRAMTSRSKTLSLNCMKEKSEASFYHPGDKEVFQGKIFIQLRSFWKYKQKGILFSDDSAWVMLQLRLEITKSPRGYSSKNIRNDGQSIRPWRKMRD